MFLTLDTSLVGVSLALFSRGPNGAPQFVWRGSQPANAGSVAAIAELTAQGFDKAKIKAKDLKGLIVSPGPGSFTGIKVGLAFAQGLKLAIGEGLSCFGCAAIEAAVDELRRQRGLAALGQRSGTFVREYRQRPHLAALHLWRRGRHRHDQHIHVATH